MGAALAVGFRKKCISMPIDFVRVDSCTIRPFINSLAVDPSFNSRFDAIFMSVILGVHGLLAKVAGTA
jgi:hypothetical protein